MSQHQNEEAVTRIDTDANGNSIGYFSPKRGQVTPKLKSGDAVRPPGDVNNPAGNPQ
jgi:hypothetical protein